MSVSVQELSVGASDRLAILNCWIPDPHCHTCYLRRWWRSLATLMVITRLNAVHALLYLIVSLLAVAVIF